MKNLTTKWTPANISRNVLIRELEDELFRFNAYSSEIDKMRITRIPSLIYISDIKTIVNEEIKL